MRKHVIIGAYKEALELRQEQFEDDLLRAKEDNNLSDEDWKILEPEIRESMEEDYPVYIDDIIRWYLDCKTPEGRNRLKRAFEIVKVLNSKVEWIEEEMKKIEKKE